MDVKHWQEHEVHFRKKFSGSLVITEFPDIRGVSVYLYGGSLEECIAKARKNLSLGDDWEVVDCKAHRS